MLDKRQFYVTILVGRFGTQASRVLDRNFNTRKYKNWNIYYKETKYV